MVGRSICGATETSRKSVLSHGSSNIFNKPFEASTPIFSGSHITTALYSASRLKREFAYDFIRLAFGDEPLLIVEPNPPVPHLLVEIAPRRKHRLPPLGQKGIAHGFLRTLREVLVGKTKCTSG